MNYDHIVEDHWMKYVVLDGELFSTAAALDYLRAKRGMDDEQAKAFLATLPVNGGPNA